MQPVLKYPGAKWNIAHWIIQHMPKHTTYLEPFFGSGAVFFNKIPSKLETINDIDGNVINLFKVIRDYPEEIARLIEFTPWSREEYYLSYEKVEDPLENARRFLVRCWQAHSSTTNTQTGWRNEIQALQGTSSSKIWPRVPERIKEITKRFLGVQIESQPAVQIIERYNFNNVLIYADPPYLLNTRSGKMYANEMTEQDHVELLETLNNHSGPVIISGYPSELYDSILNRWRKEILFTQKEKGGTGQEVLWINPIASKELNDRLF